MNFSQLQIQYEKELTEQVIPFWLEHSIDREAGGFFTCLTQKGEVFDTDKFVWLQARQVWMFAKLYNQYQAKKSYLQTALHGAAFLQKFGRDPNGDWYFSLDRTGRPLVQAYNIFSDCFACMAFGQLYQASQKEEYATLAVHTFFGISNA